MNDRNLVEALRARDPGAPAVLYDAYAEGVYRYCRSLLRDADAAQVALRDALIAAEAHAGALADPTRLRSWLYALARAECLRRRTPGPRPPAPDSPAAGPPDQGSPAAGSPTSGPSPADPPDGERAWDEPPDGPGDARLRMVAWHAVHSLPPADRELLDLAIRHELPAAELGLVLGLPARQVAAAREAALGRLRDAITVELLATQEPSDCPRRAAMLKGFSGRLTPETRERLVRHLSECAICAPRRNRPVSAAKVFELLPAPDLPDALRLRVLSCFADPELAPYRRYVARRTSGLGAAGFPVPQKKAVRRWPRAVACLLAAVGAVVAIAVVFQWFGRDGVVSDVATAAFPPTGEPPAVRLPWQERPRDVPMTVEPVANTVDVRRGLPAPAYPATGVPSLAPTGGPPVGGDPAGPSTGPAGPSEPPPGGPSAQPSGPLDPVDPAAPPGPGAPSPSPGSTASPGSPGGTGSPETPTHHHGPRPGHPCPGRFRPHCHPPRPAPTATATPAPTQEPPTPPTQTPVPTPTEEPPAPTP
ncbi:RNA polymerase sigma factor [Nonomuraea coxensis DSM 45129]|uniref:RNA polymerase sigma factor n=1 Tax=Nonomuraea coxensis DSM 45129 TaxID=1122611 RepID=A0ABX8UE73_9ACTN|nr:sigma-70 family RNA polymerase sigma factor [Nonomuraea coxensis]QYC45761.1 RNA polymerase sigma factor [Nonomuraea coxensis DSM 45129]